MSNRDDLIAGARRCLEAKGWARTTVRDISAASGGVSMAAIGYHFGSREALLNTALMEAIDEWGSQIGGVLAAFAEADVDPAARYRSMWDQVIESFAAQRTLWLATVEALLQSEHSDELRRFLAAGQADGRRGLAAALCGVDEAELNDENVRTVGSVQAALVSGIMTQWLISPDDAPSGHDVVAGLRALASFTAAPPVSSGR